MKFNKLRYRAWSACLILSLLVWVASSHASIEEPSEFFSDPSMISASMNTSGDLVAALVLEEKVQKVILVNSKTGGRRDLIDASELSMVESSVHSLRWIDDRHLAIQLSETREGVKDLLDTKKVNRLFIVNTKSENAIYPKIYEVKTKGWLVNTLPEQENIFLYAKSGPYSKVYKIDLSKLSIYGQKLGKLTKKDGGQFVSSNEVASVNGYAIRWFFGNNGSPMASLNYNADGDVELRKFSEEDDQEQLKVWKDSKEENLDDEKNLEKRLIPVALSPNPDSFYCLDFSEEEERSVYEVNFSTGEETLVYESDSYKILDLITTDESGLIQGVKVLGNGEIQDIYFDGKDRQKGGPNGELEVVVSSSRDGKSSLLYRVSHDNPRYFLVKNNKSGKTVFVGSIYPNLHKKLNSQLYKNSVEVEGLDIPYLLTLPDLEQSKSLPLIVMPHGGPFSIFDGQYFDSITQFFAANGYAVLRVNFRGSGGYSTELREAGKKEWGGLMIKDIYEATTDVMARPDIDSERVCAVGFSYGGYASTMLSINYPDVFGCAVNVAGVSDLNLYVNSPLMSSRQRAWAKEYIGDPSSEYEQLKSISPVYSAEKIKKPILLMHGTQDNIVDIEHAYRLKLMMEASEVSYDWHEFPDGGHGPGGAEDEAIMFTKIIDFVRLYLD